ncbi:tyrosine-type recombinase/integrase [Enterococcus olivae]
MGQGIYRVTNAKIDLKFTGENSGNQQGGMKILDALDVILKQLKLLGRRERTLHEYRKWTLSYVQTVDQEYLSEITVESIFQWLSSMEGTSNATRNIRLKSFKAVLSRCFDNGWIPSKFWKNIQIKVDTKVKPAATDDDIRILLSVLDLSNWHQLRDATAILLMYRTGIRLATLSSLKEEHVDYSSKQLLLSADIMKNHDWLKLPLDEDLLLLLRALTDHNKIIRSRKKKRNSYVFITEQGNQVQSSFNNNVVQKRLGRYGNELNLQNINPHALRRGFATNLMKKDAPISLISKALGHTDTVTTSKYLYLSKEEVAESLKQYL